MNSSMSEQHIALIERACTRLVLDAAASVDQQDYEAFAALFLPDGVLYRPTDHHTPIVGREAILAVYQARPADRLSRHICSNMRVWVESETRASVHTYVQVFSGPVQESEGIAPCSQARVGEFYDLCVKQEEQWFLAERRAKFTLNLGA